ncbi:carboxyl-terminal processing protease [Moraxella cuniculi DSM 21768]|uniref:Carboxyl-terminal processing protease n=1 Tax=Moraxella cuniculi DSM 21768 TaxID=1122245 RepID=A0A1N7FLS9_9GAMM|nr:S41 family peptidase [Moraxella cuniculi]SIS01196.1 carboxyl-terminal processing protease [Moraxella cuniculi DSM 21768]
MKPTILITAVAMGFAMTASANTASSPVILPTASGESESSLQVLDAEPNQLYGISGLHAGRVPLNTISPLTLKTFVQAVDLMRREYVEPVDDELLFQQAMRGMLTGIDRNAEFLDETAFANLNSFTTGNVAGVGLKATYKPSEAHWVVDEVAADSPAKAAGIAVGDYLHQIGDIKLNQSQSDNDIIQLLNGIAGTSVDVTYSRAGRSKQTSNLLRNQMQKSTIEILTQNNIAIIKLPVFQNNTRQEIVDRLQLISTPIQGVVIDLRNNPGGVLDAAVEVASLFMRKKVVTQVQNRTGIERVLETQGSPILESMPVIILQNRYSASAAEVLSSSLQTHGRALIVGETSYGKGSVQSIVPIGRNQGIKLTTARYLTPKGGKIDKIGVVPDVSFEPVISDEAGDEWLQLSLNLMEQAKASNQ